MNSVPLARSVLFSPPRGPSSALQIATRNTPILKPDNPDLRSHPQSQAWLCVSNVAIRNHCGGVSPHGKHDGHNLKAPKEKRPCYLLFIIPTKSKRFKEKGYLRSRRLAFTQLNPNSYHNGNVLFSIHVSEPSNTSYVNDIFPDKTF